jgi:hypothetical protein
MHFFSYVFAVYEVNRVDVHESVKARGHNQWSVRVVDELYRTDHVFVWLKRTNLFDFRLVDQRFSLEVCITFFLLYPSLVVLNLKSTVWIAFEPGFLRVCYINLLQARNFLKHDSEILHCHLATFITHKQQKLRVLYSLILLSLIEHINSRDGWLLHNAFEVSPSQDQLWFIDFRLN